jgi:hypothetical protein
MKRKVIRPQESLPVVPYSVNLKVSEEAYRRLMNSPGVVMKMRLDRPVRFGGVTYRWFVHPVKLVPDGPPVDLGQQTFCRDEAEALAEEKRWLSRIREQEEERVRAERERPIPGKTVKGIGVVDAQKITVRGTPISLLKHYVSLPKCRSALDELDPPFVDAGNCYWPGNAMKAVITRVAKTTEAFRIVEFDAPVQVVEGMFNCAVEYAEFEPAWKVIRVMERWLCATKSDAMRVMSEKEKLIPKLRAQKLNEPAPSPEDVRDEQIIGEIQKMADKAHDPVARARHLKRIEEIRAAQKERKRVAAAAEAERAKLKREKEAVLHQLLAEYYPNVEKLKRQNNGIGKVTPEYAEQLKRAMRIDSARLGIPSPCNPASNNDQFVLDVAKAIQAKSPFKPEQAHAVLNWFGKYEHLPEKRWTADVAKSLDVKVKPAGLGKTISKKFGLKSKLKGRPETESGKNGGS